MKPFNNRLLLNAILALLSTPVLAVDMDNDVPSIMSTGQANVNAVNSARMELGQKLMQVGQGISDNFNAQNNMMGKLAEAQINAQRDLMVNQEIANARRRALEIYGDQGTDYSCTNGPATAIQTGRTSMQQTRSGGGSSMEKRSRAGSATGGSRKQTEDLLDVPESDVAIDIIYPKQGTLDETGKAKVQAINEKIVDPFPPNQLPDKLKKTETGAKHDATRRLYEMTKEAPRNAQNVVLSMKTNDFPVNDWVTGAWKEMGKTGTPDGVIDNKLSYDAFVSLFVKSRIDSDAWYKKVTGAGEGGEGGNDVWQLRQMNLSLGMLLEIQYQQLQLSKHMLELMAQSRSNEIDQQYLPQIDDMLNRTNSTIKQ